MELGISFTTRGDEFIFGAQLAEEQGIFVNSDAALTANV